MPFFSWVRPRMSVSLPAPPLLELTLRPGLDVLLGCWHCHPDDPAELRPCY